MSKRLFFSALVATFLMASTSIYADARNENGGLLIGQSKASIN